MGRKLQKYTAVGKRIATLGRQVDLAKALGVSQQTISKKLRGETAIFFTDLEKLAKRYGVAVCHLAMPAKACPALSGRGAMVMQRKRA